MVIFLNLDGTAQKVSPQRVFQGSNNVTNVDVIAPFPSTTALTMGFILPSGLATVYLPMQYAEQQIDPTLGVWTLKLNQTVTEQMGTVGIAVNALTTDGNTTSYLCNITVEESVLPVPPPDPSPDAWESLLLNYQKLAAGYVELDTDITDIRGDIGTINVELSRVSDESAINKLNIDYLKTEIDKQNEDIASAVQTSNEAKTTAGMALMGAEQAYNIAEGIDGKATLALEQSATAITTANAAKTTADGIDAKATQALADSAEAVNTANTAETNVTAAVAQIEQFETDTTARVDELAKEIVEGQGTKVTVGGVVQATWDADSKADKSEPYEIDVTPSMWNGSDASGYTYTIHGAVHGKGLFPHIATWALVVSAVYQITNDGPSIMALTGDVTVYTSVRRTIKIIINRS